MKGAENVYTLKIFMDFSFTISGYLAWDFSLFSISGIFHYWQLFPLPDKISFAKLSEYINALLISIW